MTTDSRDVIVVGSGFGGSVAALRLAEKGYRVTVLEAGRRFTERDFATKSWQLRRFVWAPWLRCFGVLRFELRRLHPRRRMLVLTGSGVGGGSLVFSTVALRPNEKVFSHPAWDTALDWATELRPYYAQAERMLGVTRSRIGAADEVLRQVADDMGAGETFEPIPCAVYQGASGADPYFNGLGPDRAGCQGLGNCSSGCPTGAKNSTVKNYLHLAERLGVSIEPQTTVTRLRPRPDGTWDVHTRLASTWPARRRVFHAGQVVLAAGVLGTGELLHRARSRGDLPNLSPALGTRMSTNREVMVTARAPHAPGGFTMDPGNTLASMFRPDPTTLVQLGRSSRGGMINALMAVWSAPLTWPELTHALATAIRHPIRTWHRWSPRHVGATTAFLHAIEDIDSAFTGRLHRRVLRRSRLGFGPGHGPIHPVRLPILERAARLYADRIGGRVLGCWPALLGIPWVAHLLGGCPLAATPNRGVVDLDHRVHGYPTLHVADGSVVPTNLGANPALTITAMAERAFARWPTADKHDPMTSQDVPHRTVKVP